MRFNNLVLAWRHLRKDKVTTAINVIGLTIGVTACLLTYLIILAELSYDTFHTDKNRIYRVVSTVQVPSAAPQSVANIPFPATDIIRKDFEDIESVAVFMAFYGKVAIPFEDQELVVAELPEFGEEVSDIILAQVEYFDIFQYEWLAGNKDSAMTKPFQLVLTESKAHQYFGPIPLGDILGREVIYNDSLRSTVTGIVRDWEGNTDFNFNDFISFQTIETGILGRRVNLNNWQSPNRLSQTFVKLKEGTQSTSIESKIVSLFDQHPEASIKSTSLQPLLAIHYDEGFRDLYSSKAHLNVLYTLNAIALFILVLAVINYINLSTAQAFGRSKEIGIRKMLGSHQPAIMLQFLIETFILTGFAVVLALILVDPALGLFSSYLPKKIGLELITPSAIVGLIGGTIVISFLAGFYPAFVASRYSTTASLSKHKFPKKSKKNSFRKVLIVIQFTISIVLINCSLVINRQIYFLLTQDPGINQHNVISFNTPFFGESASVEKLFSEIQQLPEVKIVSRNMGAPLQKNHRITTLSAVNKQNAIQSELLSGDEHYIDLFEIKLIAGRNFIVNYRDAETEFLINESAAKELGFDDPADAVGETVACDLGPGGGPRKGPVVGIVADFHSRPLQNPINPVFFIPSSRNSRTLSAKFTAINSGEEFDALVQQLNDLWLAQFPGERFRYSLLDREAFGFYSWEFSAAQFMGIATIISIFISCIGLFGLATFTTQQRTKEIGIRKVVGASVANIVMMLSKEFVVLILIAMVFASPIAWIIMNTWLKFFAYHTSFPFWAFLIAGLVALVISLLTISSHAVRVARKNPVTSLRFE